MRCTPQLRAKYVRAHRAHAHPDRRAEHRRRRRRRSSRSRRASPSCTGRAAKRRERDLTYNPRTRAELEQLAPGFFWETLLATEGVDAQPQFVVRELDAVQALGAAVPAGAGGDLARLLQVPLPGERRRGAAAAPSTTRPSISTAARCRASSSSASATSARCARSTTTSARRSARSTWSAIFPASSREQVRALVENLRASYARAHPARCPG